MQSSSDTRWNCGTRHSQGEADKNNKSVEWTTYFGGRLWRWPVDRATGTPGCPSYWHRPGRRVDKESAHAFNTMQSRTLPESGIHNGTSWATRQVQLRSLWCCCCLRGARTCRRKGGTAGSLCTLAQTRRFPLYYDTEPNIAHVDWRRLAGRICTESSAQGNTSLEQDDIPPGLATHTGHK